MKRNKSGISLIVLVITIIVMIILAAAVVISLSDSNVINKAKDAVSASDLKQVQQLASLAWAEAYLENIDDIEGYVLDKLESQGVKVDNYDIEVTKSGVEVKKLGDDVTTEEKWELVKTIENGKVTSVKVTNGIDTLDVGTPINYMPEGVGPADAKYTGKWSILGVDDEGRLLIISANAVIDEFTLGSDESLEEAAESYENALTILQNAVNDYKDGTIGVAVRSVEIEDIDALTAFDKTTYGEGNEKYGIKVTYSWDGDEYPTYSYGTETGDVEDPHSDGFTYYDVKTGKVVTSPYIEGESGKIAEIENNSYEYHIDAYLDSSLPASALIKRKNDNCYWIASRSIAAFTWGIEFGLFCVYDYRIVAGFGGSDSTGWFGTTSMDIRAVVTLASGIKLTESSTSAGTYDVSLAK